MKVEINALGVQLAEEGDQLLQRAAKAIDRPGRHLIEFAPSDAVAEAIVTRPLVAALGAADPGIGIGGNHIPAVPLGDGRKLALLVLDGLLCRGDPKVKGNSLCHGDPLRFVIARW